MDVTYFVYFVQIENSYKLQNYTNSFYGLFSKAKFFEKTSEKRSTHDCAGVFETRNGEMTEWHLTMSDTVNPYNC